jgi:hypothetical protein
MNILSFTLSQTEVRTIVTSLLFAFSLPLFLACWPLLRYELIDGLSGLIYCHRG